MATKVSLGGVALGGDTAGLYEWEFRAGAQPVERLWAVSKRIADLIPVMVPLELVIEGPSSTLKVAEVYVLEVLPGLLPAGEREQQAQLRLADRRWKWAREWIATTMNLRRATGETRLVNAAQEENALLLPELEYARFSLFPPDAPTTPWTAELALQWLFQQLGTPLVLEDALTAVEIESLLLDDTGADAVERLLAYLPGAAVWIDAQGQAVIFDVASGREQELLPRIHARPQAGSVQVVNREPLAPSEYVIHFTPELELRADYAEPATGATVSREEDTNVLRAVLQVPDFELELEDRTVARGTWADQLEVFSAWGAFGVHNAEITYDELRKHSLKYGWANFEQAWGNNPLAPPDAVNASRARAAAASFRRFFRLDRFFWQRIESMREVRIAILDPSTGTYAPAEVFCDWTRRPSFKGFARTNDPNVNHGWANRGYAALLADAFPAPVRARIVDGQSGVLELVPSLDPWGLAQAMVLGYPQDGILPRQGGIGAADSNRTGREVYARWDMVELEAGWQVAIVLTVVPASPNTTERFWSVRVPGALVGVPGRGPPLHLRVFPGVTTARFAWTDSQGPALVGAIKGQNPLPGAALFNAGIVNEVANATARRAGEVFLSRAIGDGAIDLAPEVSPRGTVDSVRHQVAGGVTRTIASFRAARVPADIWRYLSASTRQALMNVLNRPGAGQAQGSA